MGGGCRSQAQKSRSRRTAIFHCLSPANPWLGAPQNPPPASTRHPCDVPMSTWRSPLSPIPQSIAIGLRDKSVAIEPLPVHGLERGKRLPGKPQVDVLGAGFKKERLGAEKVAPASFAFFAIPSSAFPVSVMPCNTSEHNMPVLRPAWRSRATVRSRMSGRGAGGSSSRANAAFGVVIVRCTTSVFLSAILRSNGMSRSISVDFVTTQCADPSAWPALPAATG
jgi:hypothetical protein